MSHGDRVVGDDDEARVGRARHFTQQIADVFDIPKIGAAECAAAIPAGKLKEDMPLSWTVRWF
jgi:hypothetical protein